MGSLSQQLDRYAAELDSGRWRQIRDRFRDESNGRCAGTVWEIANGADLWTFIAAHALIVEEVHRLVPKSWKCNCIPTLNDKARIPFSTFAQAARTVAWKERLKEQERTYGAEINFAEFVKHPDLVTDQWLVTA